MSTTSFLRKTIKRQHAHIVRAPIKVTEYSVYCYKKGVHQWVSPFASCNRYCNPEQIRDCPFLSTQLTTEANLVKDLVIEIRDDLPQPYSAQDKVGRFFTSKDIELLIYLHRLEISVSPLKRKLAGKIIKKIG